MVMPKLHISDATVKPWLCGSETILSGCKIQTMADVLNEAAIRRNWL